jgi:hypothetical protein
VHASVSRMAFRRRKKDERDPFAHLSADREEAESGTPWFMGDDGSPNLDIQAGISSNIADDDAPLAEPYADEAPPGRDRRY